MQTSYEFLEVKKCFLDGERRGSQKRGGKRKNKRDLKMRKTQCVIADFKNGEVGMKRNAGRLKGLKEVPC